MQSSAARLGLKATSVGELARQQFELARQGAVGTVLHASASTVYLRTPRNQLLVITRNSIRAPVSVNTPRGEDFDKLIFPSEMVYVRNKALELDQVCIDLARAATYSLPPLNFGQPLRLHQVLGDALRRAAFEIALVYGSSGVLDAYGLVWPAVSAFVRKAHRIVLENRVDDFLRYASRLVGLGAGFTPSGDDFLGGFLAVFNTFAPSLGLRLLQVPSDILARTTWISGKMLDYMQHGLVSEDLWRVIEAIAMGDGDELLSSLHTLAATGHTSGVDMSVGVILAASLMLDLHLGFHTTQSITRALGLQPE